mgnify:CR=1 FL=1
MQIEIDNKKYELNVDAAKKHGLLVESESHKEGDYYFNRDNQHLYVLVFSEIEFGIFTGGLMNIRTGVFFDYVSIGDKKNISTEDWKAIAGHNPKTFQKRTVEFSNFEFCAAKALGSMFCINNEIFMNEIFMLTLPSSKSRVHLVNVTRGSIVNTIPRSHLNENLELPFESWKLLAGANWSVYNQIDKSQLTMKSIPVK